jgi:hypothetical protein
MTAETDESILESPDFVFVGSESEYRELRDQNRSQNSTGSSKPGICKILLTTFIGALAAFCASKIISTRR